MEQAAELTAYTHRYPGGAGSRWLGRNNGRATGIRNLAGGSCPVSLPLTAPTTEAGDACHQAI